jgi:hypothetical protein
MSNTKDPFEEINNNEIFQELRAFAATPVPEDAQVLANLVHEFSAAKVVPTRRWFKRLVIPTVTIVIAVPSLAYAGLLPERVTTDIKQIVHSVSTAVSKPIVAITNSISGNSDGPKLNSTPVSPASPSLVAPTSGSDENSSDITS